MNGLLDDKNMITMKLLHYFITEKNYNPIILQGVDNEIWLENLNEDCKVVRIVSSYIHNEEQFDFDTFKTKKILSKIKKKTFSLNINVLSIFLDLGDNIKIEDKVTDKNFMYVKINKESDLSKSDIILGEFPDLIKKIKYKEKGEELFMKITKDINIHNQEDARKVEKVFKIKFPFVTYLLIAINIIFYFLPIVFGEYQYLLNQLCTYGPLIRTGQYYRLFTGMILHNDVFHLFFNCYSLYVIGAQMESYLGKKKFFLIYIFSGLIGALFSMTFNSVPSIGASGAIFGLLGSMIYFGYHYRVFLGNVVLSQIIPIVLINLGIGFVFKNIDNACHIGGLIGGLLLTSALGIDHKSTNFEKFNGFVITTIFTIFIWYMAFIYTA